MKTQWSVKLHQEYKIALNERIVIPLIIRLEISMYRNSCLSHSFEDAYSNIIALLGRITINSCLSETSKSLVDITISEITEQRQRNGANLQSTISVNYSIAILSEIRMDENPSNIMQLNFFYPLLRETKFISFIQKNACIFWIKKFLKKEKNLKNAFLLSYENSNCYWNKTPATYTKAKRVFLFLWKLKLL